MRERTDVTLVVESYNMAEVSALERCRLALRTATDMLEAHGRGELLRGRRRAAVERAALRFETPSRDPEVRRQPREVYGPHDERLRALLATSLPWDGRP